MSALPEAGPRHDPATPPATPGVQLHDTLASARRLWVRGRLDIPTTARPAPRKRRWWKCWRRRLPESNPFPLIRVQTQVANDTLSAEVPAGPDGRFEALFDVSLPPARKGWRVARHQVDLAGQAARVCSVVLAPPADAVTALVFVLPLAFTYEPGGTQRLARSANGARLAEAFRRLQRDSSGPCPLYFVGAGPPGARSLQPELALAATALDWPGGHFLLLPTGREAAAETLAGALDRLRWLFAGCLELLVLNREPEAEVLLRAAVGPRPDRAAVSRFAGADGDPRELLSPQGAAPARAPRGPRPTRATCVPRHPLVFCHGMLAMSMLRMQVPEDCNYFTHLRSFFEDRGVCALYPNVEPTGGVAERAEQLRDQVRRWTDEPVNVIAHSMGGLDARYLISRLGMAGRVRSLTTVATPHRGSALADWFCLNFRQRVPLLLTLEAFGMNVDGFRDCRVGPCRSFNESVPDAPGVRYFSYGGAVVPPRITPLLRRGWNILTPLEGPNDGLVSVQSARWGDYLGTLSVDHFAQTPDGLFVRPGENFDALGFYSRLVEDLARRGL
jgi:triacylglycerol lipase